MVQDTYNSILNVGCRLKHALDNAMVLCQSWGFNGLKRLYRYFNTCIHHELLCIENEMYDDHFIVAPLNNNHGYQPYHPLDLKDHAHKWLATLKDACSQLAGLNITLVQKTGKQSCHVKAILKDVYKLKEKAHRFLMRAENVQWMMHDLHVYDDMLHEKIKHKEEKHGH